MSKPPRLAKAAYYGTDTAVQKTAVQKGSLYLSRCLPSPEFPVKILELSRLNRGPNPGHQRQVEMQVVDGIQP